MAAAPQQAAGANPAIYAQAGLDPVVAQQIAARRQFLAQILSQIGESGKNIRTPTALGLNLLAEAVAQGGYKKASTDASAYQQKLAAAIYPNDSRAQRLFLMDPEGMSKAEITRYYTPMDVRQGNTVLNAPTGDQPFTAPIMHDDGGVYSTQTPTGATVTPVQTPPGAAAQQPQGAPAPIQRPMNYQEQVAAQNAQTAAAAQAEAARHNPVMEGIARQEIPIKQAEARAALTGAGAAASNANVTATQSPHLAPPPGYVLDH